MIAQRLGDYFYELGPIRPPSEAYSLLIRVTRNCSWNRCLFCSTYKGEKFTLRSSEEIYQDIKIARAISDEIKAIAWRTGYGNKIREVAAIIFNEFPSNHAVRNVALWLYAGGESAFLQDANSLIMRVPDLIKVITFLKETFPDLKRITSYARSKTAAKKSLAELKELKDAGLSRLHIGLETGDDTLLNYMEKGVTAEEHIKGGTKIKEAGISLCEYVMPGLGGKKRSKEHLVETARVLNEINPDFIRLRSLHVNETMPLWRKIEEGEFELLTEEEVVAEIGELIERLEVESELKSDHILNLLPEIEGKLPEAKSKCLEVINKFLSLPPEEKLNYQFGRRAGYYEKLAELNEPLKRKSTEAAMLRLGIKTNQDVNKIISRFKRNFI